ncbi:MAG: OadG family protein [Candidatus Cyclobacteriaceae bacterium M3_2C_046]
MNADFQVAFTLLLVGMVTVFLILSLVVFMGGALINFVNKNFPAEVKPEVRKTPPAVVPSASAVTIEPGKLSAMVAAVEVVTRGKATITKVEKVN